jgi:MoxR-like ATPase/integrase
MKKTYEPFVNILKNTKGDYYKSTFEEIERIIGSNLPTPAYEKDSWWSTNVGYSFTKRIMEAGWKVAHTNFNTEEVEFEKANLTPFQKLRSYILNKMNPLAIYQSLIITTLIKMEGASSKETLSNQIKAYHQGKSSFDYEWLPLYEVLKENNILKQKGDHFSLNGYHDFNNEEKREIVELCEQKIKEFKSKNIEENIQEELKKLKDEDVGNKFINDKDFAKFLEAVPMISPFQLSTGRSRMNAKQFQTLYRLLYGSALKIKEEALKLKVRDLDLQNRLIFVGGSRNPNDSATILPCDVMYLNQHIDGLKENDLLFNTNRQAVWQYAKMAGRKAGLKIAVTKGEKKIKGAYGYFFRDSRARQMHLDGATDDFITRKLRKKFENTEYKDSLPTIEDLKNWESKTYPFDYSEINSKPQRNTIINEIIEPIQVEPFADEILILPSIDDLNEAKKKIQKELLIDDHIIDQIVSSLYSGKHVLLTGPVGTGKTHLAQILPKVVWEKMDGYYPETVTATADWTTQDVIGGIFPKIKNNEIAYLIQNGCVTSTVSRNWLDKKSKSDKRVKTIIDGVKYRGIWLVIDEFNRANIDRAFGQLFTAFEYNEIKIPTTDPTASFEEIKIPKDYRIIGTLNTFDKHFLFKMSDALKRRFSFIEILPPRYEKKLEELKFIAEKALTGLEELQKELNIRSYADMQNDEHLVRTLDNLYEIMAYVRLSKNLGTALLISMFRFILINFMMTKDWDKSLDHALTIILLPQLESLQYWQIDSIMNFVKGRIHELFRKFDVNRPDVDRYEEELNNLTRYLSISGKNKDTMSWNSKFRTGEMHRIETGITDLDPWKNTTRPILRKFVEVLTVLKQEKGHLDKITDDITE